MQFRRGGEGRRCGSCELGFVLRFGGDGGLLEAVEVAESAVEVSAEGGLVTQAEGERIAGGEFLEAEREAGAVVDTVEGSVDFRSPAVHLEVKEGGFDAAGAAKAPADGGDLVDEVELEVVGGFEGGDAGVE